MIVMWMADLRLALIVPLLLLFPGVGLLWLMRVRLRRPEHGMLAVALSLAVVILDGLVLGLTHHLTPRGWMLLLPLSGLGVLGFARTQPRLSAKLKPRHILMLLAAIGVFALAYDRAAEKYQMQHPFRYTDFWMRSRGPDVVVIGITNGEGRPMAFDLRLRVDREMVGIWRDIRLARGETITRLINLPAGKKAEAWLSNTAEPDHVFRAVSSVLTAIGGV